MYAHSQGWQRELRHECVSVMAAEVHSCCGELYLLTVITGHKISGHSVPNTRFALTDIRPYVQSAV